MDAGEHCSFRSCEVPTSVCIYAVFYVDFLCGVPYLLLVWIARNMLHISLTDPVEKDLIGCRDVVTSGSCQANS